MVPPEAQPAPISASVPPSGRSPDARRVHLLGHSVHDETTLAVALIALWTATGMRVGSIKCTGNIHELEFPGKTFWRQRQSGGDHHGRSIGAHLPHEHERGCAQCCEAKPGSARRWRARMGEHAPIAPGARAARDPRRRFALSFTALGAAHPQTLLSASAVRREGRHRSRGTGGRAPETKWSDRQDLNLRLPRPKRGALAKLSYGPMCGSMGPEVNCQGGVSGGAPGRWRAAGRGRCGR